MPVRSESKLVKIQFNSTDVKRALTEKVEQQLGERPLPTMTMPSISSPEVDMETGDFTITLSWEEQL